MRQFPIQGVLDIGYMQVDLEEAADSVGERVQLLADQGLSD